MDLDAWLAGLFLGRRIGSARDVGQLCLRAAAVLVEEPNVVCVASPVMVCGDLHGQFSDLLALFRACGGAPPGRRFIFLGDYVDRGSGGVEVFELLLCLKCRYPDAVVLVRGNHESCTVSRAYGFYDECLRKYGTITVWRDCCGVFDCLTLAAVVDGSVGCVHGGLSPRLAALDDIQRLERRNEVPTDGPVCDLLWSDPSDDSGEEWALSNRGAGYLFGAGVAARFLSASGLDLFVRSHQLAMEGHRFHFGRTLLTVWSAPDYCGRCGNAASVLRISPGHSARLLTFRQLASGLQDA